MAKVVSEYPDPITIQAGIVELIDLYNCLTSAVNDPDITDSDLLTAIHFRGIILNTLDEYNVNYVEFIR